MKIVRRIKNWLMNQKSFQITSVFGIMLSIWNTGYINGIQTKRYKIYLLPSLKYHSEKTRTGIVEKSLVFRFLGFSLTFHYVDYNDPED